MASSFGWNSGCLCSASVSTRRRIAPAMNAPRIASNPRWVARAPRPATSSIDSRMRIWAEVSASLSSVRVIHMERSMRSVAMTTRTAKTPSSDRSSSLGPTAVARPEKKRESKTTELTSPSEAPAIANWPTGRSATPASFRIGTIIPSDVAMRMIPMSSGLSTTPAACSTIPMIKASTTLRPSASPARRARGPRKWRTSISRPARNSRNASPIVDSSRTAWSGCTKSSTAGPSTIPATISSTGPGTGTRGTAAKTNGTAAATASTATRLSKFIAATTRSRSGNAPRYGREHGGVGPPTSITAGEVLDALAGQLLRGRSRSPRIGDGELLERARPEVAHIVNMVTLEQRRDAATVGRGCRDMQHQLAVPERLVVDRQSVPVVAELLEGSHDAGAQSVAAAVRVQDACSLLTAQDFHRRDVDSGRCEVAGEGLHLRPLGQQAYHAEGGPVIEMIDVDLGLVHVTIFARVRQCLD